MELLRWLRYYATLGMARYPNAPEGSEPMFAVHAFVVNYALPFEAMYIRVGRRFVEVHDWHMLRGGVFAVQDVDGDMHVILKADGVWCVLRPKAASS
jgi:hypothetical protein